MQPYNPKEIEPKWQKHWDEQQTYRADLDESKEKFYALIEFPYPSGAGLHVGHPRPFTAMDVISRKKRMEGKNVLYPIGFDAFGLPTENYAIKTGRPPAEVTAENIANFTRQLKSLGFGFDWSRMVDTTDPAYYKWTQWIFLQLYKHGLAYKKNMPINWCLNCKIGLANEEVVDGTCERCGGPVEKRDKEQWMLAITKYADSLLDGLNEVDYIPMARTQQENWIGRSSGASIKFKVLSSNKGEIGELEVFTTRPDTLFGVTYMVVAPEHELVAQLLEGTRNKEQGTIKNVDEVHTYVEKARLKSDLERTELQKEKTGVELKGLKAINPATEEEIPIFVADYVLATYGTGAIMAVPAHDERDYEFAKKYNIPIKQVVAFFHANDTVDDAYRPDKPVLKRHTINAIVKHWQDDTYLCLDWEKFGWHTGIIGGVEKGEDIVEAAMREIREETGYKNIKFVRSVGGENHNVFFARHKDENRYAIGHGLYFELIDGEYEKPNEEEIKNHTAVWIEKDSMVEFLNLPNFKYVWRQLSMKNDCFSDEGITINSEFLNDLKTPQAKETMIQWLEEKGVGKRKVQFKLRDWVFSRQRYWGEPIPLVKCDQCENKKYKYVFVHGFNPTAREDFFIELKKSLEDKGHEVSYPSLPNSDAPNIEEQVAYLKQKCVLDKNTIVVAHSLGGAVVMKLLEQVNLQESVEKVVLVDCFTEPTFNDKRREPVEKSCDWKFSFDDIRSLAKEWVVIVDKDHPVVPQGQEKIFHTKLGANIIIAEPEVSHFCSTNEPIVQKNVEPTGWIPLPEDQLPLTLPQVEKYQPTDTGESPLAAMEDWVKTTCPKCGGEARRETDTMPNWAGSSWYFLRYMDPNNSEALASPEAMKYWGPVDWYNGGMEHVVLHLLYSRFWNQFLYDIGVVPFKEPYNKRTSHGMILAKGGEKMSKSKGNVVNPDEMVEQFGADTLRTYIMFMGPFDQAVEWDINGLIGVRRFLDRVWNLQGKVKEGAENEKKVLQTLHQTIKKVSEDIDEMRFNTAIAKMMELTNEWMKAETISKSAYASLIQLLAPFAPHIAEELWQQLGYGQSIARSGWPMCDEQYLTIDNVTIAIQVNGKLRGTIDVAVDVDEEEVKQLALKQENVAKWLEGKEPKKVIYVKGKLVSIVI